MSLEINNKTFIIDENYKHIIGKGLILLLEAIDECMSINKAIKKIGLSYSKADHIILRSEKALGFDLVIRRKGGANRDGCLLTERAREIIELYNKADVDVRKFACEKFQDLIAEIEKKGP